MENLIYKPADLVPWQFAGEDNGAPVYIKELIYAGNFQTSSGLQFEVTEDTLQSWAATHRRLRGNGIDVPLPLEHTENPEANRGSVLDMTVETDRQGRRGLFGKIQFRDKDAAELAKTAQVSIYSPAKFVDGTGNEYTRPIRHVALTDYPVIPGLEKFEAIAASLATPYIKKDLNMPMKELAARLKISVTDEEKLEDEIVAAFETKEQEIVTLRSKLPADPIKVTASYRNMLRDNRSMKLDKLVETSRLSPAARKDLEGIFCSDDSLNLVLSHENGDDGFDRVLAALSKNEPLELGERETIVLSKTALLSDTENPLLKDMAARK